MGDQDPFTAAATSPWWVTLAGIGITFVLAPLIIYLVKRFLPEGGAHRAPAEDHTPAPTGALDRALEQLIGAQSRRLEFLERRAGLDADEVARLRAEIDRLHADLAAERATNTQLQARLAELQRRIDALTGEQVSE